MSTITGSQSTAAFVMAQQAPAPPTMTDIISNIKIELDRLQGNRICISASLNKIESAPGKEESKSPVSVPPPVTVMNDLRIIYDRLLTENRELESIIGGFNKLV